MNERKKATYDSYTFKVDGCMDVGAKGMNEKSARETVERYWPRSSVTLVGVNLPQSNRSLLMTKSRHEPTPVSMPPTVVKEKDLDRVSKIAKDSGMSETEASLVSSFA